ncbi:hypothetical protein [Burkholderia alba]|uniref:hypothetical protein n=1 Tax=Burkholderia alba TaxID=2683677 RepID=UPI002B061F25|nr:hypothetical protein [Burkholderia alba]
MKNLSRAASLAQQANEAAEAGRADDALTLWQQAVEHDPAQAGGALDLSHRLADRGAASQAIALCERWAAAEPHSALPWIQAGILEANHLADSQRAIESFHRALGRAPRDHRAHAALAQLYLFALEPALMRFHATRALAGADPASALQIRSRYLSDYAGAAAEGHAWLANHPDDVDALLAVGKALYMQREFEAARPLFERALALAPSRVDAIGALGELRVLLGERAAGWRQLEALANDAHLGARYPGLAPFLDRKWRGEPLAGKRIVVAYYAGIGDNLMMARYARDLKAAGAHVTFACRPELLRLLHDLDGADEVSATWLIERWDTFDYWVFDYLLPAYLGAPDGAIPAYPAGYLRAPDDARLRWAAELAPHAGALKVGLCWYSSPHNFSGIDRFIPADALAPLAQLPGIDWFALQKNGANDAPAIQAGLVTRDYTLRWRDFADTAGFIDALDLVISIDSSPLHLAGALGKPAWGLLPAAPEWRWGLAGDRSDWYPGMRLFRQDVLHDWRAVVAQVGDALRALLRETGRPA